MVAATASLTRQHSQRVVCQQLKDCLIIGDRGYQSIDYCREVDAACGHVLIRHQTGIDPVIVQGFRDGKHIRAYASCRYALHRPVARRQSMPHKLSGHAPRIALGALIHRRNISHAWTGDFLGCRPRIFT
jgi:hypothetical protein